MNETLFNRYTLIGTNMFTLPSGTPAGVYSYEVPINERIYVKKADIIAISTDSDPTRIDIPHDGCNSVCLFFCFS